MGISDLFSNRNKPLPDVYQCDTLPEKLRNQIQFILVDQLGRLDNESNVYGQRILGHSKFIRETVGREHGRFYLHAEGENAFNDIMACIQESPNVPLILDIVETTCRVVCGNQRTKQFGPEMIRELNHRFRENGVGFQVESGRIVPMTNLVVHQEAIRPTLLLLSDPRFKTANEEFLEAFDDFKKSDYDDCLTKCCSAFESVLKIVCAEKGWTPLGNTANPLIRTFIQNSGLESFFEQPLIGIASLRNNLSSSHGQGEKPRVVPEHVARYALNATAAAILLVVERAEASP